ncbi:MAG: trypsin-like serine peptidase [Thiothrix sp.]
MSMILPLNKRIARFSLAIILTTTVLSACNQKSIGTQATTNSSAQVLPAQVAVAASSAPASISAAVAPVTTGSTSASASTTPVSSVASSNFPLPIASTNNSTNNRRTNLVSSSGKVININNGNRPALQSPGSSGNSARPALEEGADITPLNTEEISNIGTTATPAARIIREAVFGQDTRYRVNPYTYPERAVSLITYGGQSHCTGWLVSADTLVTAGHCVHSGGNTGRWGQVAAFRVYPGYSDGYAPYGSCGAREIYSSYGWVVAADDTADIGLIKLDCTIGNATGYFGYFVASSVDGTTIGINGYPGDKADAHQQWGSLGTVLLSTTNKLYYDNDTYGGMSGSPVWVRNSANDTAWGIGIHTTAEVNTNSGTRINQDIFDLITAVKELP